VAPTPRTSGEPEDVAVVLHGAGSTGAVAATLLPTTALEVAEVVAPDLPGGAGAAASALARCLAEQRDRGRRVRWVGGISLGAHAAARWAGAHPDDAAELDGLLLVMPAWTGPRGHRLAHRGGRARRRRPRPGRGAHPVARRRLPARGLGARALEAGWSAYVDDDALVVALRAASASPGPALHDLAAVTCPCGVVALGDDPLHPEAVAREWTTALPHAQLEVIERRDPSAGRGGLGVAAVAAARRAAQPCS
jgi:hypothetical protein